MEAKMDGHHRWLEIEEKKALDGMQEAGMQAF